MGDVVAVAEAKVVEVEDVVHIFVHVLPSVLSATYQIGSVDVALLVRKLKVTDWGIPVPNSKTKYLSSQFHAGPESIPVPLPPTRTPLTLACQVTSPPIFVQHTSYNSFVRTCPKGKPLG